MVSPILIIGLTLFFAFIIPLMKFIHPSIPKWIPPISILINLAILIALFPYVTHTVVVTTAGFKPPISINLSIDKFNLLFALLVQFMGFLLSIWYLVKKNSDYRFYMIFLLNILGASGIILTGDLFNSFVFLEILEISSYALVAIKKDRHALEGSMKYLMVGAISSSLYLLGIIILYVSTNTLNMADIAARMQHIDPKIKFFSFLLFLAGLGVETELFPFNGWVPDAYQGAMDSITAQLSSIVSKAGFYLSLRIFYTIYGGGEGLKFIFYLGLITFIIGELSALRQKNVKRMLSYSSLSQMGFGLFIFSLFPMSRSSIPEFAITAAIFIALNHSFSKSLLFLSLNGLSDNNSYTIDELRGRGNSNPLLGILFTIGALSIVGVPFFFGFWAKISALVAILESGHTWIIAIILSIALVEIYYYMRVLVKLFSGHGTHVKTSFIPALIMIVLAGIVIYVGVQPHSIFNLSQTAASSLYHRAMYISNVLGG